MAVSVGDRVSCSGYRGTVRYVGAVEGTRGNWIGVDWDDEERGKHDGSYNGKIYFEARTPKSGSFVRVEKLETGVSVEEALKSMYDPPDHEMLMDEGEKEATRKAFNAPFFEMVGIEGSQRNLKQLKIASLSEMKVRGGQLKDVAPSMQDIALDRNLIPSWEVACRMIQGLKYLRVVDLSYNRLAFPLPELEQPFAMVTRLVLGGCELKWSQIAEIVSKLFPRIKQLHVPYNLINGEQDWSSPENVQTMANFPDLEEVDLERNKVTSWRWIRNWSKLVPNLKWLNLSGVSLREIQVEDVRASDLNHLSRLFINDNIFELDGICALGALPRLQELLCSAVRRDEVIGRLPSVSVVNRSDISREDRRGAELDFLNRYFKQPASISEVLRPRYEHLLSKYGPPPEEPKSKVGSASQALRDDVVTLNVKGVLRPLKVPEDMLIERLKGLVCRLVKKDCELLSVRSKDRPDVCFPLDNDIREVRYYALQDGDYIEWE